MSAQLDDESDGKLSIAMKRIMDDNRLFVKKISSGDEFLKDENS
jgi:hypothetical protein